MLTLRRIIAGLLGTVFVLVTSASTFAFRVNNTLLNEDFYAEQLGNADVFSYAYDEALPLYIDQVVAEHKDGRSAALGRAKSRVVAAVREALPPEWWQLQSEAAIRQIVPYVVGGTESFSVTIDAGSRVQTTGAAIKKAAADPEALDLIFQAVVAAQVNTFVDKSEPLPFGLKLTAEEVVGSLRRILSDEYIAKETASAVDALVPYLSGRSDKFEVRLRLGERGEALKTELTALLRKGDTNSFVMDQVLAPLVRQSLGARYQVSYGQAVMPSDVQAVLEGPSAQPWVQKQMDGLVDAVVDYLVGSSTTFSLSVGVAEIKPQIGTALGVRAEQRLATAYLAAPACTQAQLVSLDQLTFPSTGIICRPGGLSLPQMTALAGIPSYASTIAGSISQALPDKFAFTESQLSASLGTEIWTRVQDIRRIIIQGVVFSNRNVEDLIARNGYSNEEGVPWDRLTSDAKSRAIANSENVKTFNDFRHDLQQGTPVMDEQTLRERIQDGAAPETYETFQSVRDSLRLAKPFIPLLLLIPLVLLVLIAVVGGSGVYGMLQTAGVALLGAGIALMFAGAAYLFAGRGFVHDGIENAMAVQRNLSPFQTSLSAKVVEISLNGAGSFFSGIFWNGVVFAVLGGAGVLAAVLLKRRAAKVVAAAALPA